MPSVNDAIIVNTGKNPVNAGVTTDYFAGGQYQWILFTVVADAGSLNVVLDGAVGQGGIKDYKPLDADFAPLMTITVPGVYRQYVLPTHMRFRVVAGSNVVIRTQQRSDPIPENAGATGGTSNGTAPTIVPFIQGTTVAVGNLTNYNGALYPVTTAHTFTATFDATKHGSPVAVPGTNGTSLVQRGAFAASTVYAAGDIVSNGGSLYGAKTGFTSVGTFIANDWNLLVQKGADGAGLTPKGAWTASTAYAVNDVVTNGGSSYRVTTAHTSPASFTTTNLEVLASVGATGPNPLIVTGLTGGTNGRLVYVKSDGVTCGDLHPAMMDEVGFSSILWKDTNGVYWLPGGTFTETGPLTPGYVRAMQPPLSVGGANYRDIDPKAAIPTDMQATANQNYVEFGKVLSTTQWRFRDPQSDGAALTPVSRYDSFLLANYPRNTNNVPAGRFAASPWRPFDGGTPLYVFTTTTSVSYPHAVGLSFSGSATPPYWRVAPEVASGSFADGQVRAIVVKGGNNGRFGLAMRVSGAATSETGLLAILDDSLGTTVITLATLVNGVYTQLATANFALTHGTGYNLRVEAEGTLFRAKVWIAGNAEPTEYNVTAFQNSVTAAGPAGPLVDRDTISLGNYATVVGNGAQAALTGTT